MKNKRYSHLARDVNSAVIINIIFHGTREFFASRRPAAGMANALAALALAACAAPRREVPPVVDLRVCVQSEADVELYHRFFKVAVAAEPRGGRECDAVVKSETLNAGKVIVRSAYDNSMLAEIEGTVDLAPQLVKLALEPGTDAYHRLWKQRKAAGR
jgi:hypothetical protein